MTESLMEKLAEISIQIFTIGRVYRIKKLEDLSADLNSLFPDIAKREWHTGTPTEEGRYLTVLESPLDEPFYVIATLRKEPNRMVWQGNIEPLAWQKIELYKATKERKK